MAKKFKKAVASLMALTIILGGAGAVKAAYNSMDLGGYLYSQELNTRKVGVRNVEEGSAITNWRKPGSRVTAQLSVKSAGGSDIISAPKVQSDNGYAVCTTQVDTVKEWEATTWKSHHQAINYATGEGYGGSIVRLVEDVDK